MIESSVGSTSSSVGSRETDGGVGVAAGAGAAAGSELSGGGSPRHVAGSSPRYGSSWGWSVPQRSQQQQQSPPQQPRRRPSATEPLLAHADANEEP